MAVPVMAVMRRVVAPMVSSQLGTPDANAGGDRLQGRLAGNWTE